MEGPPTILVGSSSATHGRPWENKAHHIQAIDRDHSEMVKFRRHDVVYDRVFVVLKRFMEASLKISVPRKLKPKENMKNFSSNSNTLNYPGKKDFTILITIILSTVQVISSKCVIINANVSHSASSSRKRSNKQTMLS